MIQGKGSASNKENCPYPIIHLCSESTSEEIYSKENSEIDDFDDGLYPKQARKINEELLKKTAVDETKYKTEMCKNWEEKGRCNYGKKCRFAHGKHELVDKSVINKDRYKSKLCNSFHSFYFCPYGQRCLFIHGQAKKIDKGFIASHYRRLLNSLQFCDIVEENEEKKRCKFFLTMENENQRLFEKINESFCRNLLDE